MLMFSSSIKSIRFENSVVHTRSSFEQIKELFKLASAEVSWGQLMSAHRSLIFSIAMGADEVKNIEIWVSKFFMHNNSFIAKVEKIWEDSLDSIPSPSVKNSNYWRESLLDVIRQNIAGWLQQTFCFQKFVDNAQPCFAFTTQVNFPSHNLNFHWKVKVMESDPGYLLKFFLPDLTRINELLRVEGISLEDIFFEEISFQEISFQEISFKESSFEHRNNQKKFWNQIVVSSNLKH